MGRHKNAKFRRIESVINETNKKKLSEELENHDVIGHVNKNRKFIHYSITSETAAAIFI